MISRRLQLITLNLAVALAAVILWQSLVSVNELLSSELNRSLDLNNNRNMSSTIRNISRSVVKKVYANQQPEGDGAIVRRTIGTPSLKNLSPFLMLDHFHVTPGAGFPDHPHRGQATVTYMMEGSFQHEDSAGHKGTIGPGDVQWMTAGKGIIHAEMPIHGPGLPNPNGMQLWVDLPKEHKMTNPTYQELSAKNIPTAYPQGEDGPAIKIISGKSFGVESPVRPLGGCWYFDIRFPKAGQTVFQDIPSGWTAFMYTLKGDLVTNTPSETEAHHTPYNTLVLSSASNETGVELKAAEDDTHLVLIAGEPLDQPVVQYGPFVMTSQEEIQKTFLDYRNARNGFEGAATWKSEIGNRP